MSLNWNTAISMADDKKGPRRDKRYKVRAQTKKHDESISTKAPHDRTHNPWRRRRRRRRRGNELTSRYRTISIYLFVVFAFIEWGYWQSRIQERNWVSAGQTYLDFICMQPAVHALIAKWRSAVRGKALRYICICIFALHCTALYCTERCLSGTVEGKFWLRAFTVSLLNSPKWVTLGKSRSLLKVIHIPMSKWSPAALSVHLK